MTALVRAGDLVRVRAGAFVEGSRHREVDTVTRHLLEARAVDRSLGRSYAVSHLSAVATLGLPVVTADLCRVHVSHVGQGKSRRDRRLHVHSAVSDSDATLHGGVLVVGPALAVVQTASCAGLRAGLIAADAALARGQVTAEDLARALSVKYGGADGRDALFREKRREDALRSLGFQVVRLTWRDLYHPASVARVIDEALRPR